MNRNLISTLFLLSILVPLTTSAISEKEKMIGSWKLIEENKMYDDSDLPSIMAVPESEQKDDEEENEDQIRQLELEFSLPNRLIAVEYGEEQQTTFRLNGTELKLGNREYKLVELTEDRLVISYDNLGRETQLVFKRK